MNAALISALAAVGGSLVGAMAPVLSNYVIQRSQTRRDLLTHQLTQRELFYADFIRDSAHLYAKSLTENLNTMDEMVVLYARVSQLRLMASKPVLRAAEAMADTISRQFDEPNLTLDQIGSAARSGKMDPLGAFSSAARQELRDIMNWNSRLTRWRNTR